jgi:hypothetical protein
MDGRVKPGHDESVVGASSPAPSIARILHQIPMVPLLANVVLLVIAVALGGVEGDFGVAAGALVALVVFRDGLDGFGHARSPSLQDNAGRGAGVPVCAPPFINIKFFESRGILIPASTTSLILLVSCPVEGRFSRAL